MRLACVYSTASTKCARRAHLVLVSLACVHPTASSKFTFTIAIFVALIQAPIMPENFQELTQVLNGKYLKRTKDGRIKKTKKGKEKEKKKKGKEKEKKKRKKRRRRGRNRRR